MAQLGRKMNCQWLTHEKYFSQLQLTLSIGSVFWMWAYAYEEFFDISYCSFVTREKGLIILITYVTGIQRGRGYFLKTNRNVKDHYNHLK